MYGILWLSDDTEHHDGSGRYSFNGFCPRLHTQTGDLGICPPLAPSAGWRDKVLWIFLKQAAQVEMKIAQNQVPPLPLVRSVGLGR